MVDPIKTYTFQCDRFAVIKEWTEKNAIYYVVNTSDVVVDRQVSPEFVTEKEAMAAIIMFLEARVDHLGTSLAAAQR